MPEFEERMHRLGESLRRSPEATPTQPPEPFTAEEIERFRRLYASGLHLAPVYRWLATVDALAFRLEIAIPHLRAAAYTLEQLAQITDGQTVGEGSFAVRPAIVAKTVAEETRAAMARIGDRA